MNPEAHTAGLHGLAIVIVESRAVKVLDLQQHKAILPWGGRYIQLGGRPANQLRLSLHDRAN
jgi:hypothetical protein